MPWVSASIPVAAVMCGGRPNMRSASNAAASGSKQSPIIMAFSWVAASEITAPMVASEPVPDVVGMA